MPSSLGFSVDVDFQPNENFRVSKLTPRLGVLDHDR